MKKSGVAAWAVVIGYVLVLVIGAGVALNMGDTFGKAWDSCNALDQEQEAYQDCRKVTKIGALTQDDRQFFVNIQVAQTALVIWLLGGILYTFAWIGSFITVAFVIEKEN